MSIKRIAALLFALLLATAAIPAPAYSESGDWNSSKLRMNDLARVMSDEDIDELNTRACDAVVEHKFDFLLITFTRELAGGEDQAEYIEYLYTNNEMGYGTTHDGVVLAINTDDDSFVFESFGRGTAIFDEYKLAEIASRVDLAYVGGVKNAFYEFLDRAIDQVTSYGLEYDPDAVYSEYEVNSYCGRFGSTTMPSWYPADVSAWTFTPAASDAPRVVDDADILSDSEEARLEARIREVAPGHNTDIVIFTDTSTHGLERRVYAADFYDFNGYGYGADHDGFCLFICMDPSSRGGWCCVTGDRSRALYTEDNANQLDDVLYDYLKRGDYYEGFYDWIGNIGNLLEKGAPFVPEWFPSLDGDGVRRQDPNAPRVADDANLIGAGDAAKLLEKIDSIKEKYGIDVVVTTSNTTYNLDDSDYVDAVYKYRGYGLGESFDGVILGILEPGDRIEVRAYGSAAEKLSSRNVELLCDAAGSRADIGDYYGAANRWLDYLDTTMRTGRTPRIPFIWAIRSVISSVAGLIGGAAKTSSAKRSMKTVRTAYSANDHLVSGSCCVRSTLDQFVRDDVTRVYSPVRTESGRDSSSGGGSSYSGGYSGSSGSSHSGSGRDF